MIITTTRACGSSQLCFFKAQVIFQRASLSDWESQNIKCFGNHSDRALQVFHAYMHTPWEEIRIVFTNCGV